jgi:peptidoglycan hydrolase-like protein with peptidoglycan-binding domain
MRRMDMEHKMFRGPRTSIVRRPLVLRTGAAVACVVVAGLGAACSSSSPASSSTSTSSSSVTSTTTGGALSDSAVRSLQTALTKVGCYHGSIDGSIGPQTTQAIRSFQAASHLAVDGVYGPDTEGQLLAATRIGVRVCVATPASTTTSTAATTTTVATAASAPCTTAAISAALASGETVNTVTCGNGWAAGSWTNSMYTAAYLLRSSNGVWVQPPANACANPTGLGIPTAVLDVSPCKVS